MRPTGKIHAAKLENSPRLQGVLAALQTAAPAGLTTRELIEKTGSCAINSIVDELRENGYQIAGTWVPARPGRVRAFDYRLVPAVPVQGDLFRSQSA